MGAVAWTSLLQLGCGSTQLDTPIDVLPTIEASDDADPHVIKQSPIGEGDPEAAACFDAARDLPSAGRNKCNARAPAACAVRCSAGDADACQRLADAMKGAMPDCASKIWSLACARDQLTSCRSYAEARLAGGAALDDVAALLRKACDGSNARACTVLGRGLSDDERIDNDTDALSVLERGCDLGDGGSCTFAGQLHAGGRGTGVDRTKAADLARRGCELGASRGCIDLSSHFFQGRGVPRDELQARNLLDKICRLDADPDAGDACFQLAVITTGGTNVPQLYARACNKDHFDACSWIVRDHYAAARYADAVTLANQLIAQQPELWLPRYTRGRSHFELGKFKEAATDFAVLCDKREDWPYCSLWLFIAQQRSGGDGKPELERAAKALGKAAWPAAIFELMLGRSTPAKLLKAAKHDDSQRQLEQECEAYYYIGQHHLIAGRNAAATKSFKNAVATGISNFIEYDAARAALALLAKTP